MNDNSGLKIAILAFLGVVGLVACWSKTSQPPELVPYTPWPGLIIPSTTPGSLAVAELDSNVALAMAQAEHLEVQRQIMQATSQAQSTADSYHYGSTATAEYWHNAQLAQEATGTAQAFISQTTRQAQSDQATATAQSMQATAEAQQAERVKNTADFWANTIPLLLVAFVGAMGIALFWILVKQHTAKIEADAYHNRFFETRAGTYFIILGADGQPVPQLLLPANEQASHRTLAEATEARIITVNTNGKRQSLYHDPAITNQERTNKTLVRWLLREAIKVAGPKADYIPRWEKLDGFSSPKWTKATDLLQAAGVIEKIPGQGTYLVGEWETLNDLLNALDLHNISFPYPTNEGMYA